ncbi:MAG TPA: DUF3488 and transglutaminase-like domain-containing protein [Candidatus Microbacterium pullistercoris]|nr:DUF3488 and transglutaminase-like domain-containing protein [Candidatus Microbacterium pullistercoris]
MTTRRRPPSLIAALAVFAAVVTALTPMTTLLLPAWFLPGAAVVAVIVAVGYGARWIHRGLALPAGIVAWLAVLAWAYPGSILDGVITGGVRDVVAAAADQVVTGIAPVDVDPPLMFLLLAAIGFLAVLVDQLAVTIRLPILAAIPLICVFVMPQLAVPRGDHLAFAVPFALALIAMIAFSSRRLSRTRTRRIRGAGGIAIAVVAAIAALVIAPRVPVLPAADSGTFARPTSIDVSIDLGDDLRARSTEEVLRVRTDGIVAPYLRLATHTRFGETGWQIDGGASQPLEDGFDPTAGSGVVGEIESNDVRTWVSDVELDTEYLPLPGDAVSVTGAGDGWNAMLSSRTARSSSTTSQGERYRAESHPLAPTRAQFDASPWADEAGLGGTYTNSVTGEAIREALPDGATDVPDAVTEGAIGEAAREVTADDRTPYETALGLQEWLRSPRFTYSLETPVEDGFDGSDIAAIEQFLDARAGYCVHFASAFALMARSLDLPTRITVGYLPGDLTGRSIDDMSVYSVAANRLHAWPEVYFIGIGWTPFDPTPGVAQARNVVVDTGGSGVDDSGSTTAPDDPDEEETSPSAEPTETDEVTDGPAAVSLPDATSTATAALFALLGVLLLGAVPALVRLGIRTVRRSAARGGDVGAAWRELCATATDVGLGPSRAESPRAFGDRLVRSGAAAEHVDPLVRAIEHRSFAPREADGVDLAVPLRRVARALAPRRLTSRVGRALLPRSLWQRPRDTGP